MDSINCYYLKLLTLRTFIMNVRFKMTKLYPANPLEKLFFCHLKIKNSKLAANNSLLSFND